MSYTDMVDHSRLAAGRVHARSPASPSRPSRPSPATRSAAAASWPSPATSASRPATPSSASPRSCSASSRVPVAPSACRASSARPRPRTSSSPAASCPPTRRSRSAWSTRSSRPRTCMPRREPASRAYVGGPAYALRAAKEAIDRGLEVDLDTGLEIERHAVRVAVRDQGPRDRHEVVRRERPRQGEVRGRLTHGGHRSGRQAGLRRQQAGAGALPRLGGADLRREVVDLLRRALHRLRPGPFRGDRRTRGAVALRHRARARRRHRLLLAEPPAGRSARRGARHRPVARHGRRREGQRRAARLHRRGPGGRRGAHSL